MQWILRAGRWVPFHGAFHAALVALGVGGWTGGTALGAEGVRIARTHHLGWTNAWVVSNGQVEVVIVPAVGRVMQFRRAGAADGPFWENPQMAGRAMPESPWTVSHGSFGGDKTWPAPQSDWNWPPPDVFDASPVEAREEAGSGFRLLSPVSARYGIRTERFLRLNPGEPVMTIETTYRKVSGDPLTVAVWVITQVRDPVAVYVPVPPDSRFPSGTSALWGPAPDTLTRRGDLLRLTRHRTASHKIGNEATAMVWVGDRDVLRVDIPRMPGAGYVDDGCTVEVYTNPDPVPYVELETLGVPRRLAVGDWVSATNTYTLFRRESSDDEADARRVLSLRPR